MAKKRKNLNFPWDTFDVVVDGKSALDVFRVLAVKGQEESNDFLNAYGYDFENPIERSEMLGNYQEALMFIRRYFLKQSSAEGLQLEIPRRFLESQDIRQVMILSSGDPQNEITQWATAIMKVVHTVAHVERDLRTPYFSDIQKQILHRYNNVIHKRDDGIFLGNPEVDDDFVQLETFEVKPKKTRDSVILKLLHKPENVAEDIFDRIGIRIVTKNIFDVLLVITFLIKRHVFLPANIKPSRSRNTLIDLPKLRELTKEMYVRYNIGEMPEEMLYEEMLKICHNDAYVREAKEDDNKHSSAHYKAIQFTPRQLIRHKNPIFEDLKNLKEILKLPLSKELHDNARKIIERIDIGNIRKEIKFFYPYEVQVLDKISFEENQKGRAAHAEYKRNQQMAAMKRVMGPLYEKYKKN